MNAMDFTQAATVLTEIVSQASGKKVIGPTTPNEFVAVAKVGLESGYDALATAISQVLSRTIFATRPYNRKFAGLEADSIRYGNHVRKINFIDQDPEEDDRIKLVDGSSIDQYVVKKPQVLQTNFYGESVYQAHITIYRDQLDVAFSGPAEFSAFIADLMEHMSNQIEKWHEETARATVANLIAGKKACDAGNVIYLLDLYQTETGLTGLTAQSIKQPANFIPFTKWLFGYLKTISDMMTERSVKFHKNFTISGAAKLIHRHTPLDKQKIYLYAKELNNMDASVVSGTFHDDYLKIADYERVNFWQAIDSPMSINAKPGYNNNDGSVHANPSAVTLDNVLGVIFDEEAAGYTVINQWQANSPFNARGGYTNMFWHFTDRYWNDFTENAVVLVLDHAPA